jgi:hypothetical protein
MGRSECRRWLEAPARAFCFLSILDDYVAEDNPIRVIDVFVDELDLAAYLKRAVAVLGTPALMVAMRG